MNRATAGLVFAGLAALAGCERTEPVNNTTPPPRTTPSTSPTTPPTTTPPTAPKENHDQQLSTWRRQLDDAKSKIDALRTRAANAPDSMKMELTGAVHELDDQVDKTQSRINECKDAVSTNWDTCRTDIEGMFTKLNRQIRDVTERFANQPNPSLPPTTPPDRNPEPDIPPGNPTQPGNPPPKPPTEPGNPGPGPG